MVESTRILIVDCLSMKLLFSLLQHPYQIYFWCLKGCCLEKSFFFHWWNRLKHQESYDPIYINIHYFWFISNNFYYSFCYPVNLVIFFSIFEILYFFMKGQIDSQAGCQPIWGSFSFEVLIKYFYKLQAQFCVFLWGCKFSPEWAAIHIFIINSIM